MLPTVLMADRVLAEREVWAMLSDAAPGERMVPMNAEGVARLHERLRRAQVFECTNVQDYIDGLAQAGVKSLHTRELARLRPPYEVCWFEYRQQMHGRAAELLASWQVGTLVRAGDTTVAALRRDYAHPFEYYRPVQDADRIVVLRLSTFTRVDEQIIFLGDGLMALDERGAALTSLAYCGRRPGTPLDAPVSEEESEHARSVADRMFTTFMALQFANCRNVATCPHEPPAKLSRARQAKGRPALLKYHTLQLGPMAAALKNEGGLVSNGLKLSLHLCRGHFATYTPERGFMGRPLEEELTVWRPAHARGSLAQGAVLKDYRVHGPAPEQPAGAKESR